MSKIKQATKHAGRGRKEEIVAELVEKIDSSNGLVFVDYQGLTHIQLEDLKRELKKLDSTIVIAKNSLLKLSLSKSKNFADFKDNEGLNLPTATVFIGGDMIGPLKKIQKAIKDFGLPKVKFGILEGSLTDESEVLKIASLPNRETLLGRLVNTLNSPIQGLAVVLNANITKFVMTLGAVAQTKPALALESTAAPVLLAQQTPAEPVVETAAPANQPAVQPDLSAEAFLPARALATAGAKVEAPIETDESADPTESAAQTEESTEEAKTEDEKSEGGEN